MVSHIQHPKLVDGFCFNLHVCGFSICKTDALLAGCAYHNLVSPTCSVFLKLTFLLPPLTILQFAFLSPAGAQIRFLWVQSSWELFCWHPHLIPSNHSWVFKICCRDAANHCNVSLRPSASTLSCGTSHSLTQALISVKMMLQSAWLQQWWARGTTGQEANSHFIRARIVKCRVKASHARHGKKNKYCIAVLEWSTYTFCALTEVGVLVRNHIHSCN